MVVAGLGPRDRAPRPADDRRPHLEAAAGDLDDVFSVFGKAQPDLWLVVGRAGAVMAVGMVFKISMRLTRQLAVRPGDDAPRSLFERVIPPILAGLIAAFGLTFAGGFITASALGYSEGLMTALVLIAVERHLDGRYRQAFAVGFLAALDRPEIWLLLGALRPVAVLARPGRAQARVRPVRTDPDPVVPARVLGLGPLLPWRHAARISRAPTAPRSPSARSAPSSPTTPGRPSRSRTKARRDRRRARGGGRAVAGEPGGRAAPRCRRTRRQALAGIAIAAALGFVWWVVISVMTQIGFSGNDRYLILGAALVQIAGGVGFGWAALELGRWLPRLLGQVGGSGGRATAGIGAWACRGAPSRRVPAAADLDRRRSCTSAVRTERSSTRRICARTWPRRPAGRRPVQGARLRQRDDRGLPGADAGLAAGRAHGLRSQAPPTDGAARPRRPT